ncbi:MAG TPA: hypothetical protein VL400_04505 [Polyangiaceae bacterium]|jgi:hypothetical protein|nr:hypothetical protein [Polyangiaceae bacterium]
MNRVLFALPVLSFLAVGCAAAIPAPEVSDPDSPEHAMPSEVDQDTSAPMSDASEKPSTSESERADVREPGDYVTFAFSGDYRKDKITLTERVVAKDASSITVDFAFKSAGEAETLRVKTATAGSKRGEVLAVEKVAKDGSTTPATRDAFEAKMAETVAVADSNDALVDEKATTLKVGSLEVPVTEATYRVRVGKKTGTLRTLTSEAFAWGDAGGSIVTADGKTIYKAELLEMGGDKRSASLDL